MVMRMPSWEKAYGFNDLCLRKPANVEKREFPESKILGEIRVFEWQKLFLPLYYY